MGYIVYNTVWLHAHSADTFEPDAGRGHFSVASLLEITLHQ
jgi:hypothetical protein